MRLERFGTQSLNARRRSTWHDWKHGDDVPEMPRAVCQWLGIKQHGTIHGIFMWRDNDSRELSRRR